MAITTRDDSMLRAGLADWATAIHPGRGAALVSTLERPSEGFSNETLIATVEWGDGVTEELVVRLPGEAESYPDDLIQNEALVLRELARVGMPVPPVIATEPDPAYLGTGFLVTGRVPGRPVSSAPSLDEHLAAASTGDQLGVQVQFLEAMAAVHRLDGVFAALGASLRQGTGIELEWWTRYIDWAADGEPTPRLAELMRWCVDTEPATEPPWSLCWGDARLGNVLYDDDWKMTALLDWELASIGPGEMDLGWFLALDELTNEFTGTRVEGFLDRSAVVSRYETLLGRAVCDLGWHEVFALVRSIAINERQLRLAEAAGVPYPGLGGNDNPMLAWAERKAEQV